MNQKKKQHQTHSFNDTVAMVAAKIAVEKLIPEVRKEIEMREHLTTQKLARVIMNPLAEVQLSQICLIEEMAESMGVSFEELSCKVALRKARREDEATGMESLQEASEGSKVMLTVWSKEEGQESYGKQDLLRIHKLLSKVEDKVQTFEELETAVVGMKPNEEKEVEIKGREEGEKAVQIKVRLERASIKKQEPKGEVNEQNQG